jgi:hypothetical protein
LLVFDITQSGPLRGALKNYAVAERIGIVLNPNFKDATKKGDREAAFWFSSSSCGKQ